MTREEWLNALANKLRADFKALGYSLPTKLHISCGWPLGRALEDAKGSRSIGQCFDASLSKNGFTEIFISPFLDKKMRVAETLIHELVHAAVGTKHGHRAPFRRCAVELGLQGKMTHTHAGSKLRERLNELSKPLGKYPHSTLDVSKRKKQTTRMIKLQCDDCGYVVRTSDKWIQVGVPICCCGGIFQLG